MCLLFGAHFKHTQRILLCLNSYYYESTSLDKSRRDETNHVCMILKTQLSVTVATKHVIFANRN